ncbi:class I SAM-dependent DNA methyltransferase [Rossellomorea yichunensis]|jgi:2-polyprenyl-3-methyl-5-hydroxy-6-metoxy-1,4-benzoquinol methylase|uniref:class I SAM-dependent DNA methyltransferase n=1 Tax=Rossellomorea yichunensis TaxID=3077331 RepID=UPI0028DEF416|nr:class I SAM-dependent methyltransferase [Rossellomorea sp. YC4-1]MDT9025437.1 class I SAM-dependent methyltransferase [Rossellomorea sp. YC4-1]
MSYERFAYVYDYLMQDVPYDGWLEFVNKQAKAYSIQGGKVLDIACGTGELSLRLVRDGYDVTGVDLSQDMLMVAQEKAFEMNVKINLFQQDMSKLDSLGEYDLITIFCDSLNYLEDEKDVKNTFESVYAHLKHDGLFLFDVHSIYKMTQIFINQTFTLSDDHVSYIWDCFPGEVPNSVEHELTFFVKDEETNQYERVEELHKQRTYPILTMKEWLEDAGFEVLNVSADFTQEAPTDHSERIFFTCKKK